MATSEVKTIVHHIVDKISDDVLQELIPMLKDMENNSLHNSRIELAKKIIAENRPLLQKLAQ